MAVRMGLLQSKLFRDDARLAGCAVEHSKHVKLGDRGPHVAKIQCAVLMLEGGEIDGREISSMSYGPTTAKAVLAYKTRRRIINFSYQKKADDIVGIMTIRALDTELALAESRDFHSGVPH